QSEPSLLSSAARQRIGARIADLTNHSDPGVRGRALGLLAKFDGLVAPAERVELLRAALEAEEPYVRAAAADTAGRIGATEVIPRLLALTEDLAVARYDLTGWTNLGGEPGRLLHAVPGRQLVAEAALHALATLSRGELVLAMSGPRQSPEEIRINAERARAWRHARAADLSAPATTRRLETYERTPSESAPERPTVLGRSARRSRGALLSVEAAADSRGRLQPVVAVDQSIAPGGEVRWIEADRDVQGAEPGAVPRPGPAEVADAEGLREGQDRLLGDVPIGAVVRGELAHHQGRGVVAQVGVHVGADALGRPEDVVHVHREHEVLADVCVPDRRSDAVHHRALPVLPPVGRVDHQRVLEAGVAQSLHRRHVARRPLIGRRVAHRLVADVQDHVGFLSLQGARDVRRAPVTRGVREIDGAALLAPPRRVVHLDDGHELRRLGPADELRELVARRARPPRSRRHDDPHRVPTRRGDRGEVLLRVPSRVPRVGIVDPAHHELVAVGVVELLVRHVEPRGVAARVADVAPRTSGLPATAGPARARLASGAGPAARTSAALGAAHSGAA